MIQRDRSKQLFVSDLHPFRDSISMTHTSESPTMLSPESVSCWIDRVKAFSDSPSVSGFGVARTWLGDCVLILEPTTSEEYYISKALALYSRSIYFQSYWGSRWGIAVVWVSVFEGIKLSGYGYLFFHYPWLNKKSLPSQHQLEKFILCWNWATWQF